MHAITIVNFKGGTGKSLLAHQLITGYGYAGIEVDPYGSLADRLPDQVARIDLGEPLPSLKGIEENVVFDFGGFDDRKLDEAAALSALLLIPFIPTLESIQTTIDTIERVKAFDRPILFVANMSQKDQDAEDARFVLEEALGMEADIFSLPLSVALQTAINENCSILDLAKQGGILGYAYKRAAGRMDDLYSKISEYIK